MKRLMHLSVILLPIVCLFFSCVDEKKPLPKEEFITIDGPNLYSPDGEKFFIRGTNPGNWLNPEGYMFYFKRTNSARLIDQAFKEMVGVDFTNRFWQLFKDNYITRDDIRYIRKTGMNTIRIPFHYKLFTNEDFMGLSANQDGFQRLDSLVSWCRESEIYLILDMHDAPGGQTGDNIDDSFGYPWLFTDATSQQLFIDIWKQIAEHYKNEPYILGYDLLNEPIAHYFTDDLSMLNAELEPLYKKAVAAIREVDTNHIILLAGAQWNSNFKVFTDSKFDDKIMYTCHRYWCDTLQKDIQDFVNFRDSVSLPIYMGETGENTDAWVAGWTRLMERNNIGWTFWPYKKMSQGRGMVSIQKPENWDKIVAFTEAPRTTYGEIRELRPDQKVVKKAMTDLIENMQFKNCVINKSYIQAMGMNP